GAIWFGLRIFQTMLGSLVARVPAWLDWIQWLIWPLVVIMILIIVYYSFTVVANLIAAPFNSLLSERVEKLMDGQVDLETKRGESITSMAMRTVWSELRKIIYQLKWLVGLLIISFIPGLNIVAPFAWIYFGAWTLAIEYVDYPMGNHGMFFAQVKQVLKQDRWRALGLGSGVMLLTLVPILNFVAMPIGVISGTLYSVKRIQPNHQFDGSLLSETNTN
ncbi:MAG: sulfate transporter CysZ, partial [Arenicellales bacterium]